MGELGGFIRSSRGLRKARPRASGSLIKAVLPTSDEGCSARVGLLDCGVPFCPGAAAGQPDPRLERPSLTRGDETGDRAADATNNFPEFTGLICPAALRVGCVLDINDDAVTIEQIELGIVDWWGEGWIVPQKNSRAGTGKTNRVVGSGPAGMPSPTAQRGGNTVTGNERDEGPGGLLRFGVPDAKLEKWIHRPGA